jgi:hypothetical protein
MDENGSTICAAGWESIPERYRSTAKPVNPNSLTGKEEGFLLWSDEEHQSQDGLRTIYRYRNEQGRECFTNVWDQVPSHRRQEAEAIDLSHVNLNTKVGSDLDGRLAQEHEILLESDYCEQERARAREGWLSIVWEEFQPLVIIGVMLLCFLAATPFALRRVGAPRWSRTLTMAIQVLTISGLFIFAVMKMSNIYKDIRKVAGPCDTAIWEELAEEPDAVARHTDLVTNLQNKIRQHHQKRKEALDERIKGVPEQ